MASKSVVIYVDKDHVPPKDVIETVVAEYKSAYGFGTLMMEKGQKVLFRDGKLGEAGAEGTLELCEMFKGEPLILYFSKSDSPIPPESVQPFTLYVDKQLNAQVIGVLHGDFSQFEEPGSTHTGEYYVAEKRLKPKFLKLMKLCDWDVNKLWESFDEVDTQTEIYSLLPEKGSLMVMTSAGNTMTFRTTETEYPWGSVTGFGEFPQGQAADADAARDPEPELSPIERAKALMQKGKTEFLEKHEAAKASVPNVPLKMEEKKDFPIARDRSGTGFVEATGLMEGPPDGYNKEQLKGWYTSRIGYMPSNWREKPRIPVTNRDVSKTDTADVSNVKDLATKYVKPIQVWTAKQREQFIGDMAKIIGHNSEFIKDPDKLMEEESKQPSAANQLGKTGIHDFDLPAEHRLQLCKENPELVQRIWGDYMHFVWSLERVRREQDAHIKTLDAQIAALETKEADKVITPEPKKEEPVPGPSPTPKPAVQTFKPPVFKKRA